MIIAQLLIRRKRSITIVKTNVNAFCLGVILLFICGCSGKKEVVGCYRSNFAEMGFFGQHVHLNADSTFNYRFAGDLINEVGHGRYHLVRDTVILVLQRSRPKTTADSLSPDFYLRDTIRFYFHNKKLFGINIETGKVVKYASGYSKHKKYLLLVVITKKCDII
jgi:hypothetical protein